MPSPLSPGNKQPAEHQESFPAMDHIGSEHAGEAAIRNTVAGVSNTEAAENYSNSQDRVLLLQILEEVRELKQLLRGRSSSSANVGKFGG